MYIFFKCRAEGDFIQIFPKETLVTAVASAAGTSGPQLWWERQSLYVSLYIFFVKFAFKKAMPMYYL